MTNLYELIHRRVRAAPGRVAIETPNGETLTYADLDERCARLAARLARLGVGRGDRVAVQVEKCVTNAAPLPRLPASRCGLPAAQHRLHGGRARLLPRRRRAGADRVRSGQARRRSGRSAARRLRSIATLDAHGQGDLVEALDEEPPHAAIAPVADDDLAALIYTSGTTGRSKGAMLTPRQPGGQRAGAARGLGLHARTTCCCTRCRSSTSTGCSWRCTARCSPARADGLAAEVRRRRRCSRLLPRATVMMGVPTFYTRLLGAARPHAASARGDAAVHLRLGAAAADDLRRVRGAHRPAHPRALRHERDRHDHLQPARRRAASPARSGCRCRASSCASRDDGRAARPARPASSRCAGRTCSPATGACRRRPPRSSRADGFFITGDVGRAATPTAASAISGRAKDLIISGGSTSIRRRSSWCSTSCRASSRAR